MNTPLKYIILRATVLMLLLLTMATAMAQAGTVVYQGQITELAAVDNGDSYTWELYSNVQGVNFATTSGNCPSQHAVFVGGNTGSNVKVKWLIAGEYFFKVTAVNLYGAMNLKVGKVTVLAQLATVTLDEIPPICIGEQAQLVVHLTGSAPWNITLQANDGTNVTTTTYSSIGTNTFIIDVTPLKTTNYTVIQVSDIHGINNAPSNTVTLVVKPRPTNSPIYQYVPQAKKN